MFLRDDSDCHFRIGLVKLIHQALWPIRHSLTPELDSLSFDKAIFVICAPPKTNCHMKWMFRVQGQKSQQQGRQANGGCSIHEERKNLWPWEPGREKKRTFACCFPRKDSRLPPACVGVCGASKHQRFWRVISAPVSFIIHWEHGEKVKAYRTQKLRKIFHSRVGGWLRRAF